MYIWAKMGTSSLFKSKDIEKGSDAPDIKGLESLDGSSLSSFQSDVIYVVVFWATWCSRSRANLPTLNSYFKSYHNKADNVDFVGITAEPLSTVRVVFECQNCQSNHTQMYEFQHRYELFCLETFIA